VLAKTEEVKLPFFAIPIAANALENTGAIVKAMSHNSYFGFG